MQYVESYIRDYPEDEVIIKGGAAAYLMLREYSDQTIPLRGIDVAVLTQTPTPTVLERWMSIMPPSYTVDEQGICPTSGIFTFTDSSDLELSLDIFVNEDSFPETEQVGIFRVERLDIMIAGNMHLLEAYKEDIKFIENQESPDKEELAYIVDKHARLAERTELLFQCRHQRNGTIYSDETRQDVKVL